MLLAYIALALAAPTTPSGRYGFPSGKEVLPVATRSSYPVLVASKLSRGDDKNIDKMVMLRRLLSPAMAGAFLMRLTALCLATMASQAYGTVLAMIASGKMVQLPGFHANLNSSRYPHARQR